MDNIENSLSFFYHEVLLPVPRGVVHHPPDGRAAHKDREAAHQAVDPDQLETGVTLLL